MNSWRTLLILGVTLALSLAGARLQAAPTSSTLKSVADLESRKYRGDPESLPGAAVYHRSCATCHEGQVPKAPHKMFLQMLSGPTIHDALPIWRERRRVPCDPARAARRR